MAPIASSTAVKYSKLDSTRFKVHPGRTIDRLRLVGGRSLQRDPARRQAYEAEASDTECIHGRIRMRFAEAEPA